MPYRQLTLEQRYPIQVELEVGNSHSGIAKEVGCHKSTISRELSRCPRGAYRACMAHQQALLRRHGARKYTKRQGWLYGQVQRLIRKKFSPEIIAQRLGKL